MDALRQALRDMKDYTVACGKADQQESQEHVHIQWTEDDHNFNKGWGSDLPVASLRGAYAECPFPPGSPGARLCDVPLRLKGFAESVPLFTPEMHCICESKCAFPSSNQQESAGLLTSFQR